MVELVARCSGRCIISIELLENVLKLMMVPEAKFRLDECSTVELLLLLCLKKINEKELPPPHTLRMALHEYRVFLTSGALHYDYPRKLFVQSFEHLCAIGLVHKTLPSHQNALPAEHQHLRLSCDAQTLDAYV